MFFIVIKMEALCLTLHIWYLKELVYDYFDYHDHMSPLGCQDSFALLQCFEIESQCWHSVPRISAIIRS